MDIKFYEDRSYSKEYLHNEGTEFENKATTLHFEFPEEVNGIETSNLNKYIVFDIEGNNTDILDSNNNYVIPKEISKLGTVNFSLYLVEHTTGEGEENPFKWVSKKVTLNFNSANEMGEIIVTEQEINVFNNLLSELNSSIAEVKLLENDFEEFKGDFTELQEQFEQLNSRFSTLNDTFNDLNEEFNEAISQVENVDIDASKSGNTATVTVTNKEGVQKSVEINDGTDYVITEEDKQEIAEDVKEEITPLIPTKTSDLTNDSGFIDKTVNDLDNYTKTTDMNQIIEDEITNRERADRSLQSQIDNKLETSLKGANNGLAELDENGRVPSSQLPSYVDDVIEGYYYDSKFYEDISHTTEINPEEGKIYIDLETNKTYRWSGTIYAEISETLALGETSSTAYRGDKGKEAYDKSNQNRQEIEAIENDLYGSIKVEASENPTTINGTIEDRDLAVNRIYGNTTQATSILPEEYQQVEYIESTGTQYIDTGIIPIQSTNFEGNVLFEDYLNLQNSAWIGEQDTDSSDSFRVNFGGSADSKNNLYIWFDHIYNSITPDTSIYILNVPTEQKVFTKFKDNIFYYADRQKSTHTRTGRETPYSIYMFGLNENGTPNILKAYKMRIYDFKFYNGDTIIRNFIPCYRKSDNEIGLYDLVNNVFYTNQGEGTFEKGNNVSIPNPDYPQAINNVEGDIVSKAQNKNLFPSNLIRTDLDYLKSNEDGSITISNVTSNHMYVNVLKEYVSIPEGNYRLKLYVDGTFDGGNLLIRNKDNNATVSQNSITDGKVLYINNNSIGNFQFYLIRAGTDCTIKFELEEGTENPEEYIEHQENSVTFPLQEGQKLMLGDYLAEDGIHHTRKQVVLDGTERIANYSISTDNAVSFIINDIKGAFLNCQINCTHFKMINFVAQLTKNSIYSYSNNSLYVLIDSNIANDIESFKSYLAEQYANGTPVTVEYELAEEEIEAYTEEQQKAYNELQNFKQYEDITIVSVDKSDRYDIVYDGNRIEVILNDITELERDKYEKPSTGIPKTDLAENVQTSLGKADTALQEHQDLSGYVKNTDYATSTVGGVVKIGPAYNILKNNSGQIYADNINYAQYQSASNLSFMSKGTLESVITGKNLETADNKVTSIDENSTDTEYPSAKAVKDYVDTQIDNKINSALEGSY